VAAAGLLGAIAAAWSAIPVTGTGAAGGIALAAVIACLTLGTLRLVMAESAQAAAELYGSLGVRLLGWSERALRQLPWEEAAVLAVVSLEVVHPARPWHTGLLGAILVAYLLAAHLAESGAPAQVLRLQVPVLAAGAGLLAIAAGAAMLPAASAGAASGWLRVLAAAAAVTAAALVLPA